VDDGLALTEAINSPMVGKPSLVGKVRLARDSGETDC
jgi:hypothetical protein